MEAEEITTVVRQELERRGVTPYRASLNAGMPGNAIRYVLEKRATKSDRLAEICRALDLEFYIGPPRGKAGDQVAESPAICTTGTTPLTFVDVDLPVDGHAACGLDSQKHRKHVEQVENDLPEPQGLTGDPDAFYAIAKGSSMIPEGISPDDYCVVSPNTPLAVGQRPWMEDEYGSKRIKRLLGFTATHLTLRGWGKPHSGQTSSVGEQVNRSFIARQGAVVGVFRDKPAVGLTALLVPDPRAYEWQQAVPRPLVADHRDEFEASTQNLVRAVHAIGGDPIPNDLRDVLLTDGVANEKNTGVSSSTRPVDVIELACAAGGGMEALSEEISGRLWFCRDWLDEHALDPTQCAVIGVSGESMEPTLTDGTKILVDRARTRRRSKRIYVIRTDDGLVVRRLNKESSKWQLISDHPTWESMSWADDMVVIGAVVWTARTLEGR